MCPLEMVSNKFKALQRQNLNNLKLNNNKIRLKKEYKYPAHFTSRAARDRDVLIFILKKELSNKVEIYK